MTTPEPSQPSSQQPEIPVAVVESSAQIAKQRTWSRIWLATIACAVIAAVISAATWTKQGRIIRIHFNDGYGLKAGDTLRYRGIDIGEVRQVRLDSDMAGVDVEVQLQPDTTGIAVEGSRFWIERPRLQLGRISGIDTVLGAKYIGVLPGSDAAAQRTDFDGLDTPLLMDDADAVDVRIRFPAGEGLAVGDPVRHLGTDIGEVTAITLSEELAHVWVECRLVGNARSAARAGTQFWIERPRLDISEIRGLETLVGGRYIAIEPTLATDSEVQHEFVGLADAPPLRRREGSLEVELEASSRMGLVRGAPVSYRGLEVGRVADVGLSSDGVRVEVQVIIEPEYAELVRDNSKWWSTGGFKLDAGLTGVEVSIDSFASWLRGGISFATPDKPGQKVATGYHFVLAERPDADWLRWQPRIAAGRTGAESSEFPLPRPVRMAVAWQSTWLGFTRRKSVQCWALPLDDGTMAAPTSVLRAPGEKMQGVKLEVAGRSTDLLIAELKDEAGLVRVATPEGLTLESWSRAAVGSKSWNGKSTLMIINPELAEPLPLDSSRVTLLADQNLRIDASVPISASLVGSPVIDSEGHQVIGLLIQEAGSWRIAMMK